MTLDARRARLWDAMELGPRWQVRDAAAGHGAAALAAGEARIEAILRMDWTALEQAVAGCTACDLCKTRTQPVFGVGNRHAHWMFVGEAPGAEEDARGEPFVGQAGRLLDNMLAAIGLSRRGDDERAVYIGNVLKCRPPGNRNPQPAEVACCEPYLQRQIALIRPKLIVVMGRFAAQSLLGTDATIAGLRGRVHSIHAEGSAIPVIVTYHPAYLLRNLADKSKSWADLCLAREVYARGADQ
jgi:DNA polymerase